MLELMTGAIFTDNPMDYPEQIKKLNSDKNKFGRVHELYGSMRASAIGIPTARPDFRLPDISRAYLQSYIESCHANGLIFNYTANGPLLGNLEDIDAGYAKLITELQWLESIGVDRITVSHPLVMQAVCKYTSMPIEVSTILNVYQANGIRQLKEQYPNINKVCMSIDHNRHLGTVRALQHTCLQLGIQLEIIATEFCKIGTGNCSQLHRAQCYNMHSYNMPENVARKGINSDGSKQHRDIKGYPWSGSTGCIFNRAKDSVAWLMSNTVWPNDILRFSELTNVVNFKITTRTAPAEYALQLASFYLDVNYDGPLAGLWLQLPASLLSARDKFDKIQGSFVDKVPYFCEDLAKRRTVCTKLQGTIIERSMNFMDLFFEFPHVDWHQINWVDKPTDECDFYECNWPYLWHNYLQTLI